MKKIPLSFYLRPDVWDQRSYPGGYCEGHVRSQAGK